MSSSAASADPRRVALVTGAASGIGAAIAARLAADGLRVFAVDRDVAASEPGMSLQADLTDPDANRAAVDAALAACGRLDVIVASAGVQHVAAVADFPLERWQQMLALMLTSPFLLAKHGWPALRESGDGRIIVVASIHGLVASAYKSAYVSAKHGAVGLVKTLALEGAADGIRAVAICPGYVRTPLVTKQLADQARAHGIPQERVLDEVLLASQPLKQLIEPEEVAELAALVAGPHGRSFSGAPLVLDCGYTAH